MSYAFTTALKANPQQSYVELLNSIREILETKYSQKPQLSCSHPLGTSFFSRLLSIANSLRNKSFVCIVMSSKIPDLCIRLDVV